eukprot:707412-Prymnesium_polylepis.1
MVRGSWVVRVAVGIRSRRPAHRGPGPDPCRATARRRTTGRARHRSPWWAPSVSYTHLRAHETLMNL